VSLPEELLVVIMIAYPKPRNRISIDVFLVIDAFEAKRGMIGIVFSSFPLMIVS